MIATGILILRVVLGLTVAAHGGQKLFGWFGGAGLTGTGRFFSSLGLRPGRAWAVAASIAEFGGGLLTALGFLGPIGPALILAVMLVAAALVHREHGFWNQAGGVEYPLLIGVTAVAIALLGSGRYAVDMALGIDLHAALPTLASWPRL